MVKENEKFEVVELKMWMYRLEALKTDHSAKSFAEVLGKII